MGLSPSNRKQKLQLNDPTSFDVRLENELCTSKTPKYKPRNVECGTVQNASLMCIWRNITQILNQYFLKEFHLK
jgi:hypothetical protein